MELVPPKVGQGQCEQRGHSEVKRIIGILLIWTALITSVHAEVVVLRSGKTVKGEVLLNNDEVVILRQKDGSRYQFPKQDVVAIRAEERPQQATATARPASEKKVACHLSMAGGTTYTPNGWGGFVNPMVFISTHHLQDRPIAIGGSIGYHGVFVGQNTYSWIPLQATLRYPIGVSLSDAATRRDRPMLGASIGYAIATNEECAGGICAAMEIGWWRSINPKSSLWLALTAQCLQTRLQVTEHINGNDYQNVRGCTLISLGITIGIQF